MSKWLNRILEWLLGLVLICVGLAGAFHEVVEKVGIKIQAPEEFTLRIVGALALALGLERFTRFARIDAHFTMIERRLLALQQEVHERLPIGIVEDYESVYSEAIRLIGMADSSIRTLVYAKGPTAPKRFLEAVASQMQEHPLLTYHVTIAIHVASMTSDVWDSIERRNAGYREVGLGDRFRISILDTNRPVGFDVMVVDEKHFAMALSAIPTPELEKEISVQIESHPRVARRIRAWLDNLEPQIISLEEARKKWARNVKNRQAQVD